ncbi:hypothetical protein [Tardiphaga sp.]|jgi:hypothetical protein|uniref:hypothetical protein n=1 Tax=Tardiphaga sp. TaxID=1926292 RepID=UPI0019B454C8|nr:hypothetical protein [Tardiphaga sp.]MBC7577738.1 hypothetical protein [Tardiphaga sp.]
MDTVTSFAKTPATIEEIRTRVAMAFGRHRLCREVEFDVVRTSRAGKGANWTITMQSVPPEALWEASDIVSDIQEAYVLAVAA